MAPRSNSLHGAAGRHPDGEPKTFAELLADPHFVFTILSLCLSLSVFFYYLWQLLFAKDEVSDKDEMAKQIKADKAQDQARLRAARARLDQQIALAAERVEARAKAGEAAKRQEAAAAKPAAKKAVKAAAVKAPAKRPAAARKAGSAPEVGTAAKPARGRKMVQVGDDGPFGRTI